MHSQRMGHGDTMCRALTEQELRIHRPFIEFQAIKLNLFGSKERLGTKHDWRSLSLQFHAIRLVRTCSVGI